jgi:hypothetical protein
MHRNNIKRMDFISMPPSLESVTFYTSTLTEPQEAFYIICAAVSQDVSIGKAAVKAIEMVRRCPPYLLFTSHVLFLKFEARILFSV